MSDFFNILHNLCKDENVLRTFAKASKMIQSLQTQSLVKYMGKRMDVLKKVLPIFLKTDLSGDIMKDISSVVASTHQELADSIIEQALLHYILFNDADKTCIIQEIYKEKASNIDMDKLNEFIFYFIVAAIYTGYRLRLNFDSTYLRGVNIQASHCVVVSVIEELRTYKYDKKRYDTMMANIMLTLYQTFSKIYTPDDVLRDEVRLIMTFGYVLSKRVPPMKSMQDMETYIDEKLDVDQMMNIVNISKSEL